MATKKVKKLFDAVNSVGNNYLNNPAQDYLELLRQQMQASADRAKKLGQLRFGTPRKSAEFKSEKS